MKNLLFKIFRQLRLISEIGISNYFKYRLAPNDQRLKLVIKGHTINVRKGTPDLGVAISTLSGEYEVLRYLLPANYEGVIIDAGGYIGTASIALKDIFPQAKLIIIEPSSENLELLKDNVVNLQNIKIVHGALVGTSEKSIKLNNRGTGESGFTVVAKPSDKPNASFIQETPEVLDQISEEKTLSIYKLILDGGLGGQIIIAILFVIYALMNLFDLYLLD